jgi:hypothetical protein
MLFIQGRDKNDVVGPEWASVSSRGAASQFAGGDWLKVPGLDLGLIGGMTLFSLLFNIIISETRFRLPAYQSTEGVQPRCVYAR